MCKGFLRSHGKLQFFVWLTRTTPGADGGIGGETSGKHPASPLKEFKGCLITADTPAIQQIPIENPLNKVYNKVKLYKLG